jgi:tetratricopeptide (TPR) repeat protein
VAEVGLIVERLSEARAGRGSIVLLSGDAGIGKTTVALAAETKAIALGMVTAWGRCREDGDTPPFRPWSQVLADVARGSHVSGSDRVIMNLLTPSGGQVDATGAGRFSLFERMTAMLNGPADRGVLAVVDDLHRADEASLAFLRFLASEVGRLPLVVLGAYRRGEVSQRHPLTACIGAMVDAGSVELVHLGGLAGAEIRSLVESKNGAVPDEVAEVIVARAEGNAFFAVEISRLLLSTPVDQAIVMAKAVPPTVREVIAHRLARLPPEARRALQAASTLGREFGRMPLNETLGANAIAVAAALQPAATTGLIVDDQTSGYVFAHALVQEAIYNAIPAVERTGWHRRAAAAVAQLGRDDDESIGALAYHTYRGDLGAGAISSVLSAARRARQRLAFEESARWLECATELSRQSGYEEQALALLLEAGEMQVCAGNSAAARSHFESAVAAARRLTDGASLARAVLGVGTTVVTAGRVDWPLVELLEEADRATGDGALRARVQSRLAIELYWFQGGDRSRALSAAALATAEASGDISAVGVALHARQFTLRSPDHLEERIDIGDRLLGLAQGTGDTDLSFLGTVWLAADVLRRGELPRYRSLVATLDAIAARSARPLWRWYAMVMGAQLATVEGRVDDAIEAAEEAGALGRRLGVEVAHAYRVGQLGVIYRERQGLAGHSRCPGPSGVLGLVRPVPCAWPSGSR